MPSKTSRKKHASKKLVDNGEVVFQSCGCFFVASPRMISRLRIFGVQMYGLVMTFRANLR